MRTIFHGLMTIGLLLMTLPTYGDDSKLQSSSFLLNPGWQGEVIGINYFHEIKPKETLIELAPDKMLGYTNLKNANPAIDPWLPEPGQRVLLPHSTILPVDAKPGITINLAEFRLFYIWKEGKRYRVRAYPVGIGTDETETPIGDYKVLNKVENPTWTIPPSIRMKRPDSPATVPPGPANPLGKFWMQFSLEGFGIHGTNKPLGVGRRVSHGCIRLYPQDIRDLFSRTAVGTPVQIINSPVKIGKKDATLFLEAHCTLTEDKKNLRQEIIRQARALDWNGMLNWDSIAQVLKENRGIPSPVSVDEPQASSPSSPSLSRN